MPKDNEVDEKVVNRYELSVSYGCPVMDESSDGEYVLYEDHAATVAELRAEVERLNARIGANAELHSRNLLDMARERNAESDRAEAAERRVGECLKFIDGIRDELHNRRTADWYPEGAHNAAAQMSEDMRLLGNACADFDPYTLTGADPT